MGLSVGMAVAMIIGLWIWDEMTFNKDNPNYERIAQIYPEQYHEHRQWKPGTPCRFPWATSCAKPMEVISNIL